MALLIADDTSATDSPVSNRLGGYRTAPGVELLGQFDRHGYTEPLFLVRRGDGRTLQLSKVSYTLLEHFRDGPVDPEQAASAASIVLGDTVSSEGTQRLIEQRFEPLGLVARDDSRVAPPSPAPGPRPDPIFRLWLRTELLSAGVVHRLARFVAPLFNPLLAAPALLWLVLFDVTKLANPETMKTAAGSVLEPGTLLIVMLVTLGSIVAHELGHAGALVRGGGRPGPIGVGFFLTLPVAFSNVSDSYRLDRRSRLRVDLGGVYANLLLASGFAVAAHATDRDVFLVLVFTQQMLAFQQLLPFVRLDGYWVISDLIGVPDLFRYVPAVFAAVFRRRSDPLLSRLRPWPRRVVTAWVVGTIGLLGFQLVMALFFLTRVVGASAYLAVELLGHVGAAISGSGSRTLGALALFDLVLVAAPGVASIPLLYAFGQRLLGWIWARRRLDPVLRGVVIVLTLQACWAVVILGASQQW